MTHYPPIMKISKMKMNRVMEIKQINRKIIMNNKMTILRDIKMLTMN
jgi:hypothetical protein